MPERAVIVGAGNIAAPWCEALKAERVDVKAVADLDLSRARERIEKYELAAEPTTDFKAAIRKHRPDFVVDVTVPDVHCTVTCAALRLGSHVIGEKPMATTMSQARRMVAASEKYDRMYMVSQSRRWMKNHYVCEELARSGEIGRLTTVNCDYYMGPHFGGFRDTMASPLIFDMAIHHFDLARFLSHADPVAVYAREFNPAGSWFKGDASASCIFEMSNGIVFTYRGSWCSDGFPTSWNGAWRLTGELGTIVMENDEMPRGQKVVGAEGFRRSLKDLDAPAPKLEFFNMHGALREMLEFLRTGRKPQTECHDNIQSLAMVLGAVESSKKGRRVVINPLGPRP